MSSNAKASDNAPAAGSMAPGFTLKSQEDKDVSLKDYAGKWVVLYFYPKAFTPGCSLEAHNFEADSAKYAAKNAVILGVSVDDVKTIKSFCTKDKLGFTLLSDPDHKVSDLYGSTTNMLAFAVAARHTFLIDPEGVVRKAYLDVSPAGHSAQVLKDLAALQAAAPAPAAPAETKK
ncbi:MAG: redoxin domain-containing protein [Alphaproteobacteria bacterium]|nr:redoxin domain-containing protein [Alphaproteobacteria bacterium]